MQSTNPSPSGRGLGEGRIGVVTSTLTRRAINYLLRPIGLAFAPLTARRPLLCRFLSSPNLGVAFFFKQTSPSASKRMDTNVLSVAILLPAKVTLLFSESGPPK